MTSRENDLNIILGDAGSGNEIVSSMEQWNTWNAWLILQRGEAESRVNKQSVSLLSISWRKQVTGFNDR